MDIEKVQDRDRKRTSRVHKGTEALVRDREMIEIVHCICQKWAECYRKGQLASNANGNYIGVNIEFLNRDSTKKGG